MITQYSCVDADLLSGKKTLNKTAYTHRKKEE